jgi:hypothetical protein
LRMRAGDSHAWLNGYLSPRLSRAAHKHVCPAPRRQQHVRHPPRNLRQCGGRSVVGVGGSALETGLALQSGSSSGGRAPHLQEPDAILAQQRQLADGSCRGLGSAAILGSSG